MGIFSVSVSGLNAAQVGILTTSHNIANASTPGYTRQSIFQTSNTPSFSGAGFIGQGTNVETIRRIYSQQLNEQMLTASTAAAEMASYLSQSSQVDNLLADPSAGLSPALSEFFKATQEMTANPASIPARQAMLSASQALVSRFDAIDQRMQEIRSGINSQISNDVSAINSYAEQIAQLNQRIINAQAAGPNQPPNDLLDQRDKLVADLNQLVRATTITQNDGTYSVFIGSGQPIVVGTLAYDLQAVAAPDDPERMIVAVKSPNGNVVNLPESLITGGSLGGVIAFRGEILDTAQNELGRIALTLAQNINDQHRLGQDLTGALGGDFFDMSLMGPSASANANNADPNVAPAVSITDVGNLTTSDYRMSFDGTSYSLVRISDGQTWTSAALATLPWPVDGITVTAGTWVPAVAGDNFLIQPTRAGASNLQMAITDPRAIAAAAPFRTSSALSNTGTGSISAGTVNAPPPPNASLQNQVTITFDTPALTYDVFDVTTGLPLATDVLYVAGADISYNGWTVKISGAPAAGDVFTVSANLNGVSDNRNGVLLGALQVRNTMEGGTANYQSAYSAMVAFVGNKSREAKITGDAQQTLYEQTKTSRDAVSGVNLDEEAANLLRFQQAYQASAKMLDVANRLFDEVLALAR